MREAGGGGGLGGGGGGVEGGASQARRRQSWGDSRTCPRGCHPGQWCEGAAHLQSVSGVAPRGTQKAGEAEALWSSGAGGCKEVL